MKERTRLMNQGFRSVQAEEIEQGIAAGLDVSVYANKEFFAMQMRQIRKGLQEGLPVEKYAKPEYDCLQMDEIRKGLAAGVDTDKYASPDITYDRMRQIRKGLAAGIDLSAYKKMEADVLRQLRMAAGSKVKLTEYIKKGYNVEQLEQIRLALEKEVDIKPYLSPIFLAPSIREITEGLEGKLDVSVYAKEAYGWQQMREIRLGLEHRLDVSSYANPFYDYMQMREIRLGLEEGLDISYYSSFMYTSREMKLRRSRLKENILLKNISPGKAEETREDFGNVQISVSKDEMEAYITLGKTKKKWTVAELKKVLEKNHIRKGILEEELEKLTTGQWTNQKILIARGRKPEPGKDGWYEYFFQIKPERTPRILTDGSVDYQNTDWFEVVEQGQKIAYYHSAESGVWGYTVTGVTLEASRGKEQEALKGKGFVLLPDKKTYLAAETGRILLNGNRMEISRLFVLEELTSTMGNVEFDGNIFVKGNIGSGCVLKATGDIQVNGFVESAVLEAGGNILLRQGVNVSGTGYIRAGKNVCGKFFENTSVYAGENIEANYCLNCELYAEHAIKMSGMNGMLAGGVIYAAQELIAYNIGNRAGLATMIRLGVNEVILQQQARLESKMKDVNDEMSILGKSYVAFQRKYPPEIRNTMEIYLKTESAIYTKEMEMDRLYQQKHLLEEKMAQMAKARAVVLANIYEGVIIDVSGLRWKATRLANVTVRRVDNRIAVFSNR